MIRTGICQISIKGYIIISTRVLNSQIATRLEYEMGKAMMSQLYYRKDLDLHVED